MIAAHPPKTGLCEGHVERWVDVVASCACKSRLSTRCRQLGLSSSHIGCGDSHPLSLLHFLPYSTLDDRAPGLQWTTSSSGVRARLFGDRPTTTMLHRFRVIAMK